MDADLTYLPKVGDTCNFAARSEAEKFCIIDKINEWPCPQYVIKSKHTGEVLRAFRHQLFRPQTPERLIQPVTSTPTATELFLEEIEPNVLQEILNDAFDNWSDDNVNSKDDNVNSKKDNSSDLDDEELDRLDIEAKCANTEQSERWAFKKLTDYIRKRNMILDFHNITPEDLGKTLRKFYAEIKTKDGKKFAPGSLRGIRAGIHRALTSPPFNRNFNILVDKEFILANKMIDNMCKTYINARNEKPAHYPAIAEGDLFKLSSYLAKYQESPEILFHCFWFLLCYLFARRGREGFRDMTRNTFQVKTDDLGYEYLVMATTEKTKNWQGGSSSKAWDYSDVRAYGLEVNNCHLSIVKVYNFYISKLNPRNEALFQRPILSPKFIESPYWFTEQVIGKNKLAEVMKSISTSAGLSQIYTNHSVRATAITVLYQSGVDTKQICKLTKHKNEESLKHYIDGQTSDQKRQCANVLSGALSRSNVSDQVIKTSSVSVPESETDVPLPVVSSVLGQDSNTSERKQSTVAQSSINVNENMQNIMMPFAGPQHFTFNVSGGACHFHFHYDSQKDARN